MIDSGIRPVLAMSRALAELEANARDATWAGRGPARRRAYNAKSRLPPGALDEARAAEIARLWRAHFEADIPPPAPTGAPPAEVATTYWLSSGDADGAVLRARLERLPPRRSPWSDFFPCAHDEDAMAVAEDAARRAASLLRFTPSEPLRGWHRAAPAEGPPDGWRALRIEGRSMGAPVALMMLSQWLEVPLDPTLAATGDVDAELRLVLPGDSRGAVAAKLRAVARERACIRKVFVPRGCTPDGAARGPVEVVEIDHLAELAAAFGLRIEGASPRPISVQGWMQAVDEAEWLIRARAVDVPTMRRRLEQLDEVGREVVDIQWSGAEGEPPISPGAVSATKLHLLGRLCGFHAHSLDGPRAEDARVRIDALVAAARPLPLSTLATVRNAQASVMIDAARFVTARRYANEALAAATTAQEGAEAARIASTLGRIEAHARRDGVALELLERALVALEENIPWETNLCACYRIGTLSRLGAFAEARASLDKARHHATSAPGVTAGWRDDNLLYLDYEELKLALREGDAAAALSAVDKCDARVSARSRGPWPASGILLRGVEAHLLARDAKRAEARFAALVAFAARHHAPHLAIEIGRAAAALVERALRDHRPLSAALLTRIDAWLRAIPDGEGSPLPAPRDACRAALSSPDMEPRTVADAIRALLDTEIY